MKDNTDAKVSKRPFVSGIIVAAGSSVRMNAGLPAGTISKPLIKLGRKTVFEYVIEAFAASSVDEIAQLVLYLASPEGAGTNGASLRVDAGELESVAG